MMLKYRVFSKVLFSMILSLGCLPAAAQMTAVPFDDPSWDLSEATGAQVVTYNGRQSLYIQSGAAMLEGVAFTNGIIEVDVSAPTPRAFAGVKFRMQSPEEYEDVYVRLHKSGSPDAIQYNPVFNGVTPWQLYGPGSGWANARFDKEGWVPMRLEIEGNRVRIFAGQAKEPVMDTRLAQDVRSGGTGIWALFGAYFSNFRYTPLPATSVDFPDPQMPAGTITQWDIGPAFQADQKRLEQPPASSLDWTPASTEPGGLLNISRYLESANLLPESGQQVFIGTYARTIVHSNRAQVKKMLFGYSDNVVVFLNGTPIFTGKSGFRSRDPLFQGIIGYHDALFLDFEEGENELVFAVADAFGGWGLMAKFADADGINLNLGE